jgi:multidrug efflux pump subunit AcrA (membrane-fusion protein)
MADWKSRAFSFLQEAESDGDDPEAEAEGGAGSEGEGEGEGESESEGEAEAEPEEGEGDDDEASEEEAEEEVSPEDGGGQRADEAATGASLLLHNYGSSSRSFPSGKPVLAREVGGGEWTWFPTQTAAGRAFGIDIGPVSKCCNGTQRTAHGREFKFADDASPRQSAAAVEFAPREVSSAAAHVARPPAAAGTGGAAAGESSSSSARSPRSVTLMGAPTSTFRFPEWSESYMPAEPRDFGETLKEYESSRAKILGGPLGNANTNRLTQKQMEARKREAARRAERKKAVEEKLAAQRRLHEEKQKKIRAREAEKELARMEREREKNMRAAEREAARIRAEAARAKRREEQAREKLEKFQEMEERRKEKDAQVTVRKRWQERSTVEDELLPDTPVPAGICCSWDGDGELSQGDLVMAWSFLNANGNKIVAPRLSLAELRDALLVPERALELTDIHVALLRVLLLHMDAEFQTAPPRGDLLTTLTWPYMAFLYLEENADRLSPEDYELATLLAEQEYCDLSPQTKLRLLALLCDECVGVDPVKSKYSDTRAIDMEWNDPTLRKSKSDVEQQAAAEAAEDEIKSCQLLGMDRYRNRFFACQDHSGETWVLVQVVDQGCWKQYQEAHAAPPPEGTDSDDELFAELDAAETAAREAERAQEEAEKAAQEALEEQKAEQKRAEIVAALEAEIAAAAASVASVTSGAAGASRATVASVAPVASVASDSSASSVAPVAKPRLPPLMGFNRRGVFCEDCKLKSANYGLPDGTGKRKRWCSLCAKKDGRNGVCAKDLQKLEAEKTALEDQDQDQDHHQDQDQALSSPGSDGVTSPTSPEEEPLRLRGAGLDGAVNPSAATQQVAPAPVKEEHAQPNQPPPDVIENFAGTDDGKYGLRDNGKPVLARLFGTEKWTWFPTQTAAGRAFGLEVGPISKCCNGAQRTAHGREFKFALDKHQPDLSLRQQAPTSAPGPRQAAKSGKFAELKDPDDVVDLTAREPSKEKWLLYPDRKDVMQLLEYLDVRGFRECSLHRHLFEVAKFMGKALVAQCDEMYAEVAIDADQDVESILAAMVDTVVALDEKRNKWMSETTGSEPDGKGGTRPVNLHRMSRTVEEWGSVQRMGVAAEKCAGDDQLTISDLEGRVIWAKFANTSWWPGRVYPLRLASKQVLKLRDKAPKDYDKVPTMQAIDSRYKKGNGRGRGKGRGRGRSRGRGRGQGRARGRSRGNQTEADDSDDEFTEDVATGTDGEKVLVQFYETDQFAWCHLSKTESFWASYRKISQKGDKPTKAFARAMRLARMARFDEERHSFKHSEQIIGTKMQRLVDALETIADTFAWEACQPDAGLNRETWQDSLGSIWDKWKICKARSGQRPSGKDSKSIEDMVMLPCLELLQKLIDAADARDPSAGLASIVQPWWETCVFRPAQVPVTDLESSTNQPAEPATGDTDQKQSTRTEGTDDRATPAASEHSMESDEPIPASDTSPESATAPEAASGPATDSLRRCEHCNKTHLGDYGSGRFCAKTCAARFATKQMAKFKGRAQSSDQGGGASDDEEEKEEITEMVRPHLADICSTSSAAAFHTLLFMLAVVPSAQVIKDQAKLNKGTKGRKRPSSGSASAATSAKDKQNEESSGKRRRGSASRDERIIALPTVPSMTSIVTEDFRVTIATLAPDADKPLAKKNAGPKKKKRRKAAQ